MAIVEEILNINNKSFIKTYSDQNKMIIQKDTNTYYDNAIDPIDNDHIYEETDILISNIDNIDINNICGPFNINENLNNEEIENNISQEYSDILKVEEWIDEKDKIRELRRIEKHNKKLKKLEGEENGK